VSGLPTDAGRNLMAARNGTTGDLVVSPAQA
jgi:hypothetical protein